MIELLPLLLLGAVAGLIAGLLGVGGGLILVPGLLYIFHQLNFANDIAMHMALGTSLATIIFTSLSSIRSHHQHKAVIWHIVISITPGILLGGLLGALIADYLDGHSLRLFFGIFLMFASIQMGLNVTPNPQRSLPNQNGMFATGSLIGTVSAIVGIGGGTMTVPFLVWCNTHIRHAVGTSAAVGLPIAVSATISYIYTGWDNLLLPEWSLGYIYLPALLLIVATTVFFAPVGAHLAHRLPVKSLKRYFAILLFILSIRMLLTG